jgi:hypothetical protein
MFFNVLPKGNDNLIVISYDAGLSFDFVQNEFNTIKSLILIIYFLHRVASMTTRYDPLSKLVY